MFLDETALFDPDCPGAVLEAALATLLGSLTAAAILELLVFSVYPSKDKRFGAHSHDPSTSDGCVVPWDGRRDLRGCYAMPRKRSTGAFSYSGRFRSPS